MNTYRVTLRDRPTRVFEGHGFDYDDASDAYWFADTNGTVAVLPASEVLAILVEPIAVETGTPLLDEFTQYESNASEPSPPCDCDGCTVGESDVTVVINGSPVQVDHGFAAYLLNEFMNGASR